MSKIQPRTLSGFMELLPAPQQQMERIMAILRETYSLYGFTPLDTPLIEASEVLLAKGGGETEKQIYRFQKGDSDKGKIQLDGQCITCLPNKLTVTIYADNSEVELIS